MHISLLVAQEREGLNKSGTIDLLVFFSKFSLVGCRQRCVEHQTCEMLAAGEMFVRGQSLCSSVRILRRPAPTTC